MLRCVIRGGARGICASPSSFSSTSTASTARWSPARERGGKRGFATVGTNRGSGVHDLDLKGLTVVDHHYEYFAPPPLTYAPT
jgi:hypothetical protein